MTKRTILLIVASLIFMGLVWYTVSSTHHKVHHHSLTEEVKQHKKKLSFSMTSEDHLDGMEKVEVHGDDSFYVAARKGQITSFPCTNCHSSSLEELKEKAGPERKKAHWNIHLEHGNEETMNCATCHNTEGKMDKLISLTGKEIDIDHSYKQCAQCHSTQYKDWQGGSHGKRLGGWVEPRVINNCVSCHSPHKPAFEKRWPARLNTNKIFSDKTK